MEISPEPISEVCFALDRVVQEIVHEEAARLALDLFRSPVVPNDGKLVPVVGNLSK